MQRQYPLSILNTRLAKKEEAYPIYFYNRHGIFIYWELELPADGFKIWKN